MVTHLRIAALLTLAISALPCASQEISLKRVPANLEHEDCGMGCVFKGESIASGNMIFSSDLTIQSDKSVHGKILIDNAIFNVKRTKNKWISQKKKQGLSVGDKFIQIWKGQDLELIFECTVANPGYEGESFIGTLTVKHRDRRAIFQIQGYQGC